QPGEAGSPAQHGREIQNGQALAGRGPAMTRKRTAPGIDPEQLEALARKIAEAMRPPPDPRDEITVAQVIDLHLEHCRDEVCEEYRYEKEMRLRAFTKLHGDKVTAQCNP